MAKIEELFKLNAEIETANKENEWKHVFEDLHVCEDGKEIEYTITEDTVALYDNVITGDPETGFTVTNYYTPKGDWNPKTGDNIMLYIITLILSLVGFGTCFYLKKQYN